MMNPPSFYNAGFSVPSKAHVRYRYAGDIAMSLETRVRAAKEFSDPYCITNGSKFRLKDIDPADTGKMKDKEQAKALLSEHNKSLAAMQDMLYADNRWAVLLIFQAMDAAGKDGAIKHVMSGINPQGCTVHPFKAPTSDDLDHDFLWRCSRVLPNRGDIGIFNRSYYEEVLVVRVHPEYLDKQRIPKELITKRIWKERFDDICNYERYLTRNGIAICKFFLHVSKKEQKKRFLSRLDEPDKNWKFSAADVAERQHWDRYQDAYEEMIQQTATEYAPWHVVPADNKWFTRLVVASAIIGKIGSLNIAYPTVSAEQKVELEKARQMLEE